MGDAFMAGRQSNKRPINRQESALIPLSDCITSFLVEIRQERGEKGEIPWTGLSNT